jgi:3-phosphoglycerate kinase
LGRPEGKKKAALSLLPVANHLSRLLGKKVTHVLNYRGKQVEQVIARMKPGAIVMLENIRFSKDEEGNKGNLGRDLATLADMFVLDGFAVSHRADASVIGIAPHLPSYAGLLLEKEIRGLLKIIETTKRPAVLVLGGVKSETKIPVLKNFLRRADTILIGGALFNTYLLSLGYRLGDSVVDPRFIKEAKALAGRSKVIKPIDVIVGRNDGTRVRHIDIKKFQKNLCNKGEAIFDIGPKTIALFSSYIKQAKTLVWNGALGYMEQSPYDIGTKSIARLVAARSKGKAYGVIGGGETVQAMEQVGMIEYIDLVSTGGGAMLDFLAGKSLPGIEALKK